MISSAPWWDLGDTSGPGGRRAFAFASGKRLSVEPGTGGWEPGGGTAPSQSSSTQPHTQAAALKGQGQMGTGWPFLSFRFIVVVREPYKEPTKVLQRQNVMSSLSQLIQDFSPNALRAVTSVEGPRVPSGVSRRRSLLCTRRTLLQSSAEPPVPTKLLRSLWVPCRVSPRGGHCRWQVVVRGQLSCQGAFGQPGRLQEHDVPTASAGDVQAWGQRQGQHCLDGRSPVSEGTVMILCDVSLCRWGRG